MTLADHAIGGTAAALIFRKNPLLAFAAAFLSHFVLDAVPHWHYKLKSLRENPADPAGGYMVFDKSFLEDVLKTGLDFGLGAAPSLLAINLFFPQHLTAAFLGVIGGVMPDFLQLVYYIFPRSPLRHLQKFHDAVHAKGNLDKNEKLGVGLQFALGILLIAAIGFM